MKTIHERQRFHDTVKASAMQYISEHANWHVDWRLTKYADDEAYERDNPFEIVDFKENLLANAGITLLLTLLTGGAGTAYTNAVAYLGVGDSNTAASASQTDLQASSNKLRKAQDSTFPSVTNQTVKFQSTFGSSDANFSWQEVGAFNAGSGGTMLNRKVQDLGTKSSGATWVLQLSITIS